MNFTRWLQLSNYHSCLLCVQYCSHVEHADFICILSIQSPCLKDSVFRFFTLGINIYSRWNSPAELPKISSDFRMKHSLIPCILWLCKSSKKIHQENQWTMINKVKENCLFHFVYYNLPCINFCYIYYFLFFKQTCDTHIILIY